MKRSYLYTSFCMSAVGVLKFPMKAGNGNKSSYKEILAFRTERNATGFCWIVMGCDFVHIICLSSECMHVYAIFSLRIATVDKTMEWLCF